MNIGALAGRPCRFASITWPISWTNSRTKADREPPAAEPDVERGRDEDREQELELEERRAELEQEHADGGERRQQLAQEREAALVAHRLRRLVVRAARRASGALLGSARSCDSWYPGGLSATPRRNRAEIARLRGFSVCGPVVEEATRFRPRRSLVRPARIIARWRRGAPARPARCIARRGRCRGARSLRSPTTPER